MNIHLGVAGSTGREACVVEGGVRLADGGGRRNPLWWWPAGWAAYGVSKGHHLVIMVYMEYRTSRPQHPRFKLRSH